MKKLIGLFLIVSTFFIIGCDEPRPYFEGVVDVEIEVGDEFDPYYGVVCFDDKGTERLTYEVIMLFPVDTNTVGEYRVTYSCEDHNGKSESEARSVFVVENADLVEELENVFTNTSAQLQVHNVFYDDTLDGYNAKHDYQFVSVCVTYKNILDMDVQVQTAPYLVVDDVTYFNTYLYRQPEFRYGTLKPGGVETGCHTFEVPIRDEYMFYMDSFEIDLSDNIFEEGLDSSYELGVVENMVGVVVSKEGYELQVVDTYVLDDKTSLKEGYEYRVVEVIVKNNSAGNITVYDSDFSLLDSNGFEGRQSHISLEEKLITMTIAPGGTIRGELAFEHPVDETNPILVYGNLPVHSSKYIEMAMVSLAEELDAYTELEGEFDVESVTNKVGSTAQTNYMQLQVNDVKFTNSISFLMAYDGNEFVIVTVRLKSSPKSSENYSEYEFSIILEDGQVIEPSILNVTNPLGAGFLEEETMREGNIVFEVPIDSEVLILNYLGSRWGETSVSINLLESLDTYSLIE